LLFDTDRKAGAELDDRPTPPKNKRNREHAARALWVGVSYHTMVNLRGARPPAGVPYGTKRKTVFGRWSGRRRSKNEMQTRPKKGWGNGPWMKRGGTNPKKWKGVHPTNCENGGWKNPSEARGKSRLGSGPFKEANRTTRRKKRCQKKHERGGQECVSQETVPTT